MIKCKLYLAITLGLIISTFSLEANENSTYSTNIMFDEAQENSFSNQSMNSSSPWSISELNNSGEIYDPYSESVFDNGFTQDLGYDTYQDVPMMKDTATGEMYTPLTVPFLLFAFLLLGYVFILFRRLRRNSQPK